MTQERQYIDFYLQLRDLNLEANTFKVGVLPSPAVGESREAVTVDYYPEVLAPFLQKLEKRSISQDELRLLGEHLANLLLPLGEIRNLFKEVVKQTGQDAGIRLRVLTSEPTLARLPWEFTYLPLYKGADDYRHFLVLNPQISLIRHEPMARPHPKTERRLPEKLHLLAAMANPQNDLNLAQEQHNLTEVFQEFQVDGVSLDWQPLFEGTTAQNLAKALMSKPELFYFAGHGTFDQQGYIQLEGTSSGQPYLMSATELALKLKQAGVRVAVFGTCESAQRDGVSQWAGVAPTLVAEGIPMVIAMQYAVLDSQAIAFSQAFYVALAAGLSVDEAVAAGRLAMVGGDAGQERKLSAVERDAEQTSGSGGAANVQWGIPVLYMRSADSVIFPREKSTKAENLRTLIEQKIGAIRDSRNFVGIDIGEITDSVKLEQDFGEVSNTDDFTGIKIASL